ncbi:DUF3429 domain-containing protein [Parasphingopyxis sp.]|uniref:DUF3429 domain-containing protein n=1 Tax=Parasphingopyxis sp. TaxID=1920299 RepID=UPI0026226C15|nr:DUF3429 domain-containing protein [Parasphingopyxis sp.]
MNNRMLAMLAYAGTLPFVGSAALTIFGIDTVPTLGSGPQIAAAWALTIASFIAGVHWGQYLSNGARAGIMLAIVSNAIAILGWLAFLALPLRFALLAFAALFAILLLIDRRLHEAGFIGPGYWRTRLGVTLVVVAALLVTAVFA